ncbi:MAG: peptide deformylase, partial [Sneathiella sp.]
MAVKPILKMGNPILNGRAAQIDDPTTEEIRDLILDMQDSMKAAGGVGLAAPQIGVSLQLVIFDVPAERLQSEGEAVTSGIEPTILINPVLELEED